MLNVRNSRPTEDIVEAAKTVFLREGYQASVDTIVREAGIARQTLYNHFKDKRALIDAVIELVSRDTMRELRTLNLGPEVTPPEALRRYGEAYMQGMLHPQNLAVTRLISSAIQEYPAVGKIAYQVGSERSIAMLAAYLESQRSAGKIRCSAPEVIAESFYGALVGPARFRYLLGINIESSAAEREEYVREIVNLYVQGLHYTHA